MKDDKYFLHLALKQATIQQGFCSPNPSVGAIIVDSQQKIISKGYHRGPGLAHAEIDALNKLGSEIPSDATMYVTLEPCCHWGRTPPCVDAIIRAGVKRVVYGFKDPNPLVSGKGDIALKNAGIICDFIPLAAVSTFYRKYEYWHQSTLPYVTAKLALSLNGAIASARGEPLSITGDKLKKFTHQCRKNYDAILTSIETIIHDNPQLNVRLGKNTFSKPLYVLDSHLRLPLNAQVFHTTKQITVFHSSDVNLHTKEKLLQQGVRCIEIEHRNSFLCLDEALKYIGKEGVHSVWVEAGGKLFSSFLKRKLLQQAYIYISLRWITHGKIAFPEGISLDDDAKEIIWSQFGSDVLCNIRF